MAEEQLNWVDRDLEFEDDDASETSADLTLTEDQFANLLVAPADWTIETLYVQIGKQIDLDPDFQRRNVWSAKAKSRFIESLLLGVPIPQILLSARPGKKSSFLVLDGKQRLISIKEFLDGKLPNGRKFRLRDLRILTELEGQAWEDMKDDPELSAKLLNETQRTTVLRGWNDESVLYEIFYRLNSGSVKLSPMELRMSLYPGDFLKFILRWTETVGPVHHLLRKRLPDPRMADVELAVRFLAFQDHDLAYGGDLKKFLDQLCERYNEKFDDQKFATKVKDRLGSLDAAIEVGIRAFGENKFCRKFREGSYEPRFNRAVFDVLTYSLAIKDVRDWADAHHDEFVGAFEAMSDADPEFVRAVETTTKSLDSTTIRFERWLNALQQVSGIKVALPEIKVP
jgi:hypothetical protein